MDSAQNLTGFSKTWVQLRRDNRYYITNKVISVVLATAMAFTTLGYKPMIQEHSNAVNADPSSAEDVEAYKFIYWFLFIFYSF